MSKDATDFRQLPEYRWLVKLRTAAQTASLDSPYYRVHEGRAGAYTRIDGRECSNFASYDYLGLNGHPEVAEASIAAIRAYGTSVSASRLVAGERPFHGALERQLASVYGVDDAVVMVSGHATNVSVIGQLLGPQDLLLHDELVHNSVMVGGQLSRANRRAFRHNDLEHLRGLLEHERKDFRRCLIVVEGLYSMDGDTVDLKRLVELKQEHNAWLMVDEAHALGVLGPTGRGSAEAQGVAGQDVDIWMGTLSKTLASAGGYVAGSQELIDYLKSATPGFVYSVGLPPANSAAAAAALTVMLREPERVRRLRSNSQLMHKLAQEAGLDTGTSCGAAIMPLRIGDSLRAAKLAQAMFGEGINVLPIMYPAVPFENAILRFFISSEHDTAQIEAAVAAASRHLRRFAKVSVPALLRAMAQNSPG